jgi:hypothetical protein
MRYVSLDLETTGLEPKQPDRILQIAMVAEDSSVDSPLETLPAFSAIIIPNGEIKGNPTALAINSWILIAIELFKTKMSHRNFFSRYKDLGIPEETLNRAREAWRHNAFGSLEYVIAEANIWLTHNFGDKDNINIAGKNVAGFDVPFLPPELSKRFRHRCIDPGSVFIDWNARSVNSSDEIAKKCGIDSVSHDAYGDAIDVIRWLRTSYPKGVIHPSDI